MFFVHGDPERQRRIRSILGIAILITIPCYCIGFIAVQQADNRPTPTITITATEENTATASATLNQTFTPTATGTATATPTLTLTPTATITNTSSPTPSQTLTPSPTASVTRRKRTLQQQRRFLQILQQTHPLPAKSRLRQPPLPRVKHQHRHPMGARVKSGFLMIGEHPKWKIALDY